MYKISKRIEVAGSHQLELNYESDCKKIHGHNWIITVEIEGICLNKNGMLIDFKHIKKVVNCLDHNHINNIVGLGNPTAENIAKWIVGKIQQKINTGFDSEEILEDDIYMPRVSKVTVQESEGNIACYIP